MPLFLNTRVVLFFLLAFFSLAPAASGQRIQVINEHIGQLDVHPFMLDNLSPGDKVTVRIDTISGSLDPVIALLEADIDFARLEALYAEEVLNRVGADAEYQVIFPEFANRHLGIWGRGGGEQGSLVFDVDNEKDYLLLVFGADSWVAGTHVLSFGDYRLQIGVNAPTSLEPGVQAMGANIAHPMYDLHRAAQEFRGTLSGDGNPMTLPLVAMSAGETLYIHVDTGQEGPGASVKLRDYGGRLLAYDNVYGSKQTARTQYLYTEDDAAPSLEIKALNASGAVVGGSFRVLVGINTPEILEGQATVGGRELIRTPIPVTVALQVDQITSISQKDENFAVVGSLQLTWVDPRLAFNPSNCKCNKKVYDVSDFRKRATEIGLRLPSYIFLNQQGNRWSQEARISIRPDGSAWWFERFSVTLQAPDFDLRRLPFDAQKFFVRLALIESTRHFVFVADPRFNLVGEHLGEEEWNITGWEASVTELGMRDQYSQFDFVMRAQRHVMYYVVRIFVPLALLIAVSWISFFLKDYSKRVDVSAGNLLAFIAFNFTLGSDLPRLGYLTFLDQLMVIAFAFAALMVIYNVIMRRLERSGMPHGVETLDSILLWAYPLMLAAMGFALWEMTA